MRARLELTAQRATEQRLVRSLLVVDAQPIRGNVLRLLDALEDVRIEHLVVVPAVEP